MRRTRFRRGWEPRPPPPTEPVGSKSFDVDWLDIIDRLAVWGALSPGSRATLSAMRSGDRVSLEVLGSEADIERLEHAGIIQVTQDRAQAKLTREAYPFARFLRALERHDPAKRHGKAAMAAYIADHFNAEERVLLGGRLSSRVSAQWIAHKAVSIVWLREFLDREEHDTADVAGRRLPSRDARTGEPTGADAHAAALTIVRWFMARLPASAAVPLRDLPRLVTDLPSDALARGLTYCVGQLLLFPAFERPARDVVIGLWPTIAQRLVRPEPEPPAPFQPEYTYDGAFAVDDMTTLLVAAAASPLRVRKKDGRIYERTRADLVDQLRALPDWINTESFFSDDARIGRARALLGAMDLLRHKAGSLRPGKGAAAWLALDAQARVRTVLDHVRRDALRAVATDTKNAAAGDSKHEGVTTDSTHDTDPSNRAPDFDDRGGILDVELFDDYDSIDDGDPLKHVDVFPLLPGSFAYWSPPKAKREFVLAARHAFAELPGDGFTPIGPFLAYQSRAANPLLSGGPATRRATAFRFAAAPTDEELEDAWTRVLGDFLADRLIPLGGAALGAAGDVAGIHLTSAGRYLLALADDFDLAATAPPDVGDVIVQPNFDIVFTAPSPRREAEIGMLAERVGRDIGVLYRVTREAVFAAAAAGITADRALATLREASSKPVPKNVEREIEDWFAACRHVALEPALLIRCPDPNTTGRVLAAGGKAVRRLSDTVVELCDPKARTRVVKKLRSQGVFVADERERKGGRTKRRRR